MGAFFLVFLVSGFLGAIPFGLVITRLLGTEDPRKSGSGNIGATNVLRTSGWKSGVLTLLLDVLKGVAAILFARYVSSRISAPALEPIAALAAVIGHMYSPFTGFRGGKGVATGLGVFALLTPGPTAFAALVFILVVAATRYVSLGSMLAAAAVPLAGAWMSYSTLVCASSALISLLVIWKHQDNIGRMMRGEENRIGRNQG
ncbi:MAG: glycerol-3-phosphate 1-O-acyltransferase PlsY [Nitrospinae bacterium]|nr:glycerol-3-phosphate 1-O-acyltransferase PlsY [Nitrospinota bacterium]